MKYYSSIFFIASIGFNFWQRQYIHKQFYFMSIGCSLLTGMVFGCVKTSWFYVEQMDKLGEEYELSRMIK